MPPHAGKAAASNAAAQTSLKAARPRRIRLISNIFMPNSVISACKTKQNKTKPGRPHATIRSQQLDKQTVVCGWTPGRRTKPDFKGALSLANGVGCRSSIGRAHLFQLLQVCHINRTERTQGALELLQVVGRKELPQPRRRVRGSPPAWCCCTLR